MFRANTCPRLAFPLSTVVRCCRCSRWRFWSWGSRLKEMFLWPKLRSNLPYVAGVGSKLYTVCPSCAAGMVRSCPTFVPMSTTGRLRCRAAKGVLRMGGTSEFLKTAMPRDASAPETKYPDSEGLCVLIMPCLVPGSASRRLATRRNSRMFVLGALKHCEL